MPTTYIHVTPEEWQSLEHALNALTEMNLLMGKRVEKVEELTVTLNGKIEEEFTTIETRLSAVEMEIDALQHTINTRQEPPA